MKHISRLWIVMLPVLVAAGVAYGGAIEKHARFGVTYHYQDYAKALSTYVDENGMVDYAGLKEGRDHLDFYVRDVAGLYRDIYREWADADRMAFWINAYNAITLQSIINNYPDPAQDGGIKAIRKVWKSRIHTAKGDMVSLDDIEHKHLRKEFDDPRIHMALVCAAQSCPTLRNEPYLPERLDEQLEDQTRKFLADPDAFRIDAEAGVVYLSPIFEWYGKDWISTHGEKAFTNYGNRAERAVIAFIAEYLDDGQRQALKDKKLKIKYLRYDWALNEQTGTE